jgi:molybdate transport system substrate-binding protein
MTVKSLLLSLCLMFFLAVSAVAGEVNLSAAVSLKDVLTELAGAFAKKNPAVTFRTNFGASGALAKQIENGAPADLFFSANVEWMDYLKQKNLIDDKSRAPFAFNELVFVGKPGLDVSGMADVVKLEKVAIGSPGSVPAGDYAMQAFKKAGIDTELEHRLVMAGDVRACLTYADRGEVDGAFVYKTDALLAKNARVLFTVPQKFYSRVTYPMALTQVGVKNSDALAFVRFLRSAETRQVLLKYGFMDR